MSYMEVEFKKRRNSEISLDIPIQGEAVTVREWTLMPVVPLRVCVHLSQSCMHTHNI